MANIENRAPVSNQAAHQYNYGNMYFLKDGHDDSSLLANQEKSALSTFKVSDYEGQKNSILDRVQGTCQWFLRNGQYKIWHDGKTDGLLWVSADPGCGKSVLSKSLIDHDLMGTKSLSCCYYFFKDTEEQGSLLSALCSVLHQLFLQKPILLRHATPDKWKYGERLQREPLLLWRLLITAATDPAAENVICVFDALDECKERDRRTLINFLKDFHYRSRNQPSRSWWLKFLVTSRPYHGIEMQFHELIKDFPAVRLAGEKESSAIGEEIKLVIRNKVMEIGIARSLTKRAQEAVEAKLLGIPNQTYLWLHLMLEEIRETLDCTQTKLFKLIDNLPKSVYDAYERIVTPRAVMVRARLGFH